jgi:DNA polymerase-1
LRPQFDAISDYLAAAGVAEYRQPEVEADDAIATLARRAAGEGHRVVIASGDKDFMQLVSERVGLINPNDASGAVWTAEQVRAKTGVDPAQVADWLALVGDAVDNIPGVPGVGPKTAAALLGQFGSAAEIFRRLDEVKPERIRLALRESAGAVQRNLALVRLPEVPVGLSPGELVPGAADVVRLAGLYRAWGFRGLLAALGGDEAGLQRNLI